MTGPHIETTVFRWIMGEPRDFGSAFLQARRAGYPRFKWMGCEFHTRLAEPYQERDVPGYLHSA